MKKVFPKAFRKEAPPVRRSTFETLKDSLALVGGLTGLSVATLWILGRIFAASYFNAMNIPSFQVDFSVWEYAEQSCWILLALTYMALVVWLAAAVFWLVSKKLLRWLRGKLEPSKTIARAKAFNKSKHPGRRTFNLMDISVIVLSAFSLLVWSADLLGQRVGQHFVLGEGTEVEVVSKTLLDLGTPNVISSTLGSSDSSAFVYEGFKLLTHNNGRYYLFKMGQIDPVTCKPIKVFIIDDSALVQANLKPSPPITVTCEQRQTFPF